MNQNQKGFVNIVLVVLGVILVGVAGYFALVKTTPVAQEPAQIQTLPVASNSNPAPVEKTLKLFGPLLLQESYYGFDSMKYEFNYPESDFSIQASSDNRKITIKEIATGKINTINISNESGRGYSPNDYWNESLKKTCATCTQVANTVNIKYSSGLVTFANESKEWIIFSGGSGWLFVAELQKPTAAVEKILSTLNFDPIK